MEMIVRAGVRATEIVRRPARVLAYSIFFLAREGPPKAAGKRDSTATVSTVQR